MTLRYIQSQSKIKKPQYNYSPVIAKCTIITLIFDERGSKIGFLLNKAHISQHLLTKFGNAHMRISVKFDLLNSLFYDYLSLVRYFALCLFHALALLTFYHVHDMHVILFIDT